MALVLTGGVGVSSVGLVTDLTGDEVLKFRRHDNIQTDDVLSFHQALFASDQNILAELEHV